MKNQAYPSLANIEPIEVVKDPAGAGGLINLVTKKADGADVAKITLHGGSDKQAGIAADFGTAFSQGFNGRINLEYKAGDTHVDNRDYKTLFIAPTLRWNLAADSQLDLDVEYPDQEVVPYRGVPAVNGKPIDVDPSTSYASSSDFQK